MGEGPEFGLIVNPHARGVRRRFLPRDRFWRDLVPERNIRITHDLASLARACADFAANGIGQVACLGGDGTTNAAINAIVAEWGEEPLPLLLPLAGGTNNGLAYARGLRGAPGPLLRRAMAALAQGRLRACNARLLSLQEADRRRLGFTFTTGFTTRAARVYYRAPDPGLGALLRAAALPLTAWLGEPDFFAPTGLVVSVNGERPTVMPHTIVAGTVERPFGLFRPFGRIRDAEAPLHLAMASLPPWQIVTRLWSIYRGTCEAEGMSILTTRSVALWLTAGEDYLIDGEIWPAPADGAIFLSAGPCFPIVDPASLCHR